MTNDIKDIVEYIKTLKKEIEEGVEVFDGHLIVDDLPSNRLVLSRMLKILKIASDEAENGLDALKKISQRKYKMIWMDIKMPIMNGIQSTKHMRKDLNYDGPIYAITAYTDTTTRNNCVTAGINKIISKPISVKLIKELSSEAK